MAGLLAVYAFDELWNLSTYVKYGLMALQHRGSEKYIACTTYDRSIRCYSAGLVDDVAEEVVSNKVIAGVYSGNGEALYQERVEDIDVALLASRHSDVFNDVVRDLGRGIKSCVSGVEKAIQRYSYAEALPSFIAISSRGDVVVWRSSSGLESMVLGGYGFDMVIAASESTAIDILGSDIRKPLYPGEGFYISRHLVKKFSVESNTKPVLCLFELLYLARHDAIVDGVGVYEFRKRLGRELTKMFKENVKGDIDIVVGVPETAIPYAIGFSSEIGKPFDLAFVSTGGRIRSMLRSDPREKIMAIHLKMNPIRSTIDGKRIALVDDSMVTGATIKTVSQILRYRIGVEEIHLLIASPPLIKTCPYNVMKLDMESLLAANLSKEMAIKYLEVDSLSWLDTESVDRVAKEYRLRLCGKCFGVDVFGERQ